MDRIARSWELLKASWAVLRADKELVLYPIVSAIAALAIAGSLFVVWLGTGGGGRLADESLSVVDLVLLFIFYVIAYAVMIFFNSALIGAANIRLESGDPTLSDGFRIAFSRLRPSSPGPSSPPRWASCSAPSPSEAGRSVSSCRSSVGSPGAW